MKLKPPVGGRMWLLMSESLRFNWFIQMADSFRNKAFDNDNVWITELFLSTNLFKKLIHSISIVQRRKTVLCSLFGTIFVGKIEQKQAILCLKCKSLIALLNLYKILLNVLSCWYLQKNGTLCVIWINLIILNYINIKSMQKHFCCLQFRMPGILSFNSINLINLSFWLINQHACTLCVIWWYSLTLLDNVRSHIITTTLTISSQNMYCISHTPDSTWLEN